MYQIGEALIGNGNEIAHIVDTNDYNLYSKLGNDISNNTIKEIIIILNDVILELK